MTELRVRRELHIVHRQESRRNNEVENPLEGYCDGYAGAADCVREDLGDEYPADRAPAEHKGCAVNHNADDGDDRREGWRSAGDGYAGGADGHTDGTADKQRLAAPFLHGQDGEQSERDIDYAHYNRLNHRRFHTERLEYARSEVEHRIDTHGLLEDAQHNADEDDHIAVGEEFLLLFGNGLADAGEDFLSLFTAVDSG